MEFKVTFIIPTIGRRTIERTLQSLRNQTDEAAWRAIVIFDGFSEIPAWYTDCLVRLDISQRVSTVTVPQRVGEKNGGANGRAGLVRNIGLDQASTPWMAFVDDDDTVGSSYVSTLRRCQADYPENDAFVFQAVFKCSIHTLIPSDDAVQQQRIRRNGIPISFAAKADQEARFINDNTEDYQFIADLVERGKKVRLIGEKLYWVRRIPPRTPSGSDECGK